MVSKERKAEFLKDMAAVNKEVEKLAAQNLPESKRMEAFTKLLLGLAKKYDPKFKNPQ